ncbi:MAG TPA: tetratricopeptide repeat protein [Cyclobacteriaceae bacterium]|nr:tetratricopeptide repeat protein [Cyclobacteriaceae bacterium]
MDDSSSPSPVSTWYRRAALGFLILFALLWSIDSFFFVTLLGLATSCWVLSLNGSGFSMPAFGGTGTMGPGPTSRVSSPSTGIKVPKTIRIFIFIFGASFFLFVFIGIISGDNNAESNSEASATTEGDISNADQGTRYYNLGSYDSAMIFYDKALAENAADLDAQYGKALTYFSKGDLDASLSWTRKSIRTKSDYNLSWWLLGDVYYTQQQYDSAAICLERADRYNTEEPDFYLLMAQTYEHLDNRQRAIEAYRKVIEKDESRSEVYEHLITLDPDNAQSYKALLEKLK